MPKDKIVLRGVKMKIDYGLMGKRIAKRRKEMKMKQNVLAEKAEISNNYLSNIENGKSIPSLDVLMTICDCLNTTPDTILIGTAKTDNIPLKITENLKICNESMLEDISKYIEHLLYSQT